MTDSFDAYERELRDAVAHRAAGEGAFDIEAFAAVVAERLEESDEIRDLVVLPVTARGIRGKQLELLAHGFDDADDSLILVVGKYFGESASLTATDARKAFDAGRAFLDHALSGWISENLEMSSLEVEVARDLVRGFRSSTSVRMFLFTDATMSTRLKTIEADELEGRPVTFSVWDVRRLADAAANASGREPIAIDFTEWMPGGLTALVGSEEPGSGMFTYLAAIPGNVLAEIFRRHGSRLLESNVRTYLGTAGKINKGIQYTLKREPSRFLAYNNGLTTTATSMDVEEDDGVVLRIRGIDDWQIVNGGQTTSSLAYFLRKGEEGDLSNVAVQMKLVLVDPENAEDMVPNISRFANSQNRVNEADFFANSEYHQTLERISKRLLPPPQGGNQYSSGWYYERARGQWDNERRALTPAKQREWDLRFPKRQRVVKTDWAKYQMTWEQKPHIVSKGAQANFLAFAAVADRLWESDRSSVNEQYFRDGIGKAILFRDVRAAVSAETWYQERRGYLANIITYAIARFAHELASERQRERLDFQRIWVEQQTGSATLSTIVAVAREVLGVLTAEDRPQANVTQWAKQELCWRSVQGIPVSLPRGLESEMVSVADWRRDSNEAAVTQRFDNGIQNVARVLDIERSLLTRAASEGKARGLLTEKEYLIIDKVARGIIKVPTEGQAKVVLVALSKLADEAVLSREEF